MSLEQRDLARLRGLGGPARPARGRGLPPLSRLLHFYVEATHGCGSPRASFSGERPTRVLVVGVAGSVAVGKSTTARILKELMSRWPQTPRVELVTTDGFLYPNAELERRGLLQRKGFPASYDRRALMRFIADVKSGMPSVQAPMYSHLTYDVLPGSAEVRRPDVLIVEDSTSCSLHRSARTARAPARSRTTSTSRCTSTHPSRRSAPGTCNGSSACGRPRSPTPSPTSTASAALSDDEVVATARRIWEQINGRTSSRTPCRPGTARHWC